MKMLWKHEGGSSDFFFIPPLLERTHWLLSQQLEIKSQRIWSASAMVVRASPWSLSLNQHFNLMQGPQRKWWGIGNEQDPTSQKQACYFLPLQPRQLDSYYNQTDMEKSHGNTYQSFLTHFCDDCHTDREMRLKTQHCLCVLCSYSGKHEGFY